MDNQPLRDPRVLEAMEACRAGSDDLADPELQFLADELKSDPHLEVVFQRIQRADRALASAMDNVPVPADLPSRLLAALAVSAAVEPSGEAVSDPAATAESAAPPSRQTRRRWGRWLAGSALVAASLVAGVGISFWSTAPTYSSVAAIDEATDAFRSHTKALMAGAAQAGTPLAQPAPLPLSRQVRATPATTWRQVQLLGTDAVAYDLIGPRGVRATLYVVRADVAELASKPPRQPLRATAGFASSVWRENDLVCLLVVEGNRDDYRWFVSTRSGPIA